MIYNSTFPGKKLHAIELSSCNDILKTYFHPVLLGFGKRLSNNKKAITHTHVMIYVLHRSFMKLCEFLMTKLIFENTAWVHKYMFYKQTDLELVFLLSDHVLLTFVEGIQVTLVPLLFSLHLILHLPVVSCKVLLVGFLLSCFKLWKSYMSAKP